MRGEWSIRHFSAALALLLALFGAASAHAVEDSPAAYQPQCHLSTSIETNPHEAIKSPGWRCDGAGWSNSAEKVWLRFDSASWADGRLPAAFYTHITRISGATVAAIDADGAMRSHHYAPSEVDLTGKGPFFGFPLPEVNDRTDAVIVGFVRPHSVTVLTKARLTDGDLEAVGWTLAQVVIVAIVLGLLICPIFFDVGFYVVLRERFVLLHLAMALAMLWYVLLASNLINLVVPLPIDVLAIGAPLTWALAVSMSVFFITEFVEPGSLPKSTQRALHVTGLWTAIAPGFFALQIDATHSFDNTAYFLSLAVLAGIICFAILQAVVRGSRSAKFLAAAWTPVILASTDRLLRGLGVYVGTANLDQMLFVALGLEVILIALGVADRFMILRRQRDRALSDAKMMENLADRDALTGLLNRRAVEPRFPSLREQGFDTIALIDLDLFKDINDRFGHQAGDAVLRSCAAALNKQEGRDTIAIRLGGEEFMLLLKGKNALTRAEAFRQAIPGRISRDVEGLDRPVTASMGVVQIPRNGFKGMTFAELYARADQLLYEAKNAGRNRTMSERLQDFGKHLKNARSAA